MLGPRAIYTTLIIYLIEKKNYIGRAIMIMWTRQGQNQYHHHHDQHQHHHHPYHHHHHQSFILTSGITPLIASPSLAFAIMTSISAIARTLLLILSLCLADNNYEIIEWKNTIIYLSTILFFYNFITTIKTTTFNHHHNHHHNHHKYDYY
jgi:hypothetical protein